MPVRQITVLIVDDHPHVRESLAVFFGSENGIAAWGTAESAEDALAQLGHADGFPRDLPSVLLVDVSMPGMNGIELVAEVVARYPSLPCVMFSGHPAWMYAQKAQAAGARGYVDKHAFDDAAAVVRRAVEEPGWVTA